PNGARSVSSVKMRTRAGMGRCQGGFCGPDVVRILSEELQIPMTDVTLSGDGSYILACETCGEVEP
ncbi:MAG: (2Fe-2S)-binding protein, partial [Firmicutes bacterium]|nr:(2Fe-2S)-binding protein [Bacillota bacterium]